MKKIYTYIKYNISEATLLSTRYLFEGMKSIPKIPKFFSILDIILSTKYI